LQRCIRIQKDMRILFELLCFSVLRIIISSPMPINIEMDNAVRFVSRRENDYYQRSSYINKEYVRMKLSIYK
jgi:hypothetical protein